MKQKLGARQSALMPNVGVTFDRAERDEIARLARVLEQLAPQDLRLVVLSALGYEIMRLVEAGDWTTPESEIEQERKQRLVEARIAWEAMSAACGRDLPNDAATDTGVRLDPATWQPEGERRGR